MKKISLIGLSLLGWASPTFAQQEQPTEIRTKKINHTVGIQINELIRQVFNFSNTTPNPTLTNPYLLTYNINSVRGGWGGRIGLGYTYRNFTDDDGISRRETDINNLQLRVGVEKAFNLSYKWSAGVGPDFLYNTDYSNTKTITRTSFDTTTTIVKSDISRMGGGAMAWVRYNLTSNVQIGTEASFYYLSGNQEQRISITRKEFNGGQGGQYKTTVTKVDNKTSEGAFRLPVAIYLLVRF